jgi:hypothetical protein
VQRCLDEAKGFIIRCEPFGAHPDLGGSPDLYNRLFGKCDPIWAVRMKRAVKILLLFGFVAVYWFYGGFQLPKDRSLGRLCTAIDVAFIFGAFVALWGGSVTIGVLHPVSLRGIFVALGTFLMVGAFIVLVATRDDRIGSPRWPFSGSGASKRLEHSFLPGCYA